MRSWVEKLRWSLLSGGVVLLLVLAGLLGYGRYKAVRTWHRILERTGATLTRETNGVTWSQSVGGRTVFTVHAAKAVQAKDGKYALHDVQLTLYRQTDGQADRIYGSDFEYDQKTGVARALGLVHMDLQAPGALSHDRETRAASQGPTKSGPAQRDAEGEDEESEPEAIHVKTSGLVYVRNLGVAATDQDVEFRYGGLECHARGAEFNSGQSTVHLLSEVQMSGEVRGREVNLRAARADLDRQKNLATLRSPKVWMAGETASAEGAVLHLRRDGSLEAAEATGAVRATRGTQVLTADRTESRWSDQTLLQDLRASGAVSLEDASPVRPLRARARRLHVSFGPHGAAQQAVADGSISAEFDDRSRGGAGLHRQASGDLMTALFGPESGTSKPALRSVKIEGNAHLSGESYAPQENGRAVGLRLAGSNEAGHKAGSETHDAGRVENANGNGDGNRTNTGSKASTSIAANLLLIDVQPGPGGQPQVQTVAGTGNTILEQTSPNGDSRKSTGDRLTLRFGPAASGSASSFQVDSAVQDGHVTLRSVSTGASEGSSGSNAKSSVTEAVATRAEFRSVSHGLELIGGTRVRNDQGELTAAQVHLDTESGLMEARGQVLTTLASAANGTAAPTTRPGAAKTEATHVVSSTARFVRETGIAEFHGSDAEPVRLWQGGSQIQAATVLLDQKRNTLTARPLSAGGVVRSVLASAGEAIPVGKGKSRDPEPEKSESRPQKVSGDEDHALRVTSAQLDYAAATHEATFGGGVRVLGALGEVHARTAVVFLEPAKPAGQGTPLTHAGKSTPGEDLSVPQTPSSDLLGGSVERVVLSGKVQLEQPGRSGSGDQLLYTAADSSFVLTGSPGRPPHVVDVQQGSVTGSTLLFRTGDNTVVVASDPSRAGATRGRVRTELNLKP